MYFVSAKIFATSSLLKFQSTDNMCVGTVLLVTGNFTIRHHGTY